MSQHPQPTFRRWFQEVWNEGRAGSIEQLFAVNAVAHGLADPAGTPVAGIDAFRQFWSQFRSAFPDIHVTVDEEIAEGEMRAAHVTVRATHTGEGIGLAATQKPILFTGMVLGKTANGQFVEVWNSFDFLSFYQQLGILPRQLL